MTNFVKSVHEISEQTRRGEVVLKFNLHFNPVQGKTFDLAPLKDSSVNYKRAISVGPKFWHSKTFQ